MGNNSEIILDSRIMIKELPLKNERCLRVQSYDSVLRKELGWAAHVPGLVWHYSYAELRFQEHVVFRCFPQLLPRI